MARGRSWHRDVGARGDCEALNDTSQRTPGGVALARGALSRTVYLLAEANLVDLPLACLAVSCPRGSPRPGRRSGSRPACRCPRRRRRSPRPPRRRSPCRPWPCRSRSPPPEPADAALQAARGRRRHAVGRAVGRPGAGDAHRAAVAGVLAAGAGGAPGARTPRGRTCRRRSSRRDSTRCRCPQLILPPSARSRRAARPGAGVQGGDRAVVGLLVVPLSARCPCRRRVPVSCTVMAESEPVPEPLVPPLPRAAAGAAAATVAAGAAARRADDRPPDHREGRAKDQSQFREFHCCERLRRGFLGPRKVLPEGCTEERGRLTRARDAGRATSSLDFPAGDGTPGHTRSGSNVSRPASPRSRAWTRQTPTLRVVAKNIEDIQLFVPRRLEQLGALHHVDPAGAAAGAPTRERHRSIAVVTEVDQVVPAGASASTLGRAGLVDSKRTWIIARGVHSRCCGDWHLPLESGRCDARRSGGEAGGSWHAR